MQGGLLPAAYKALSLCAVGLLCFHPARWSSQGQRASQQKHGDEMSVLEDPTVVS